MNLEEVKIKTFEREDLKNFKVFTEEINAVDNTDISISEEMLEFILCQPHFKENTYITYYKDKMIAWAAMIKPRQDLWEGNLEMLVHPKFRSQGLGKKLYELLLSNAREQNVKSIKAVTKEHFIYSVKALRDRGFKVEKYMWKMDYALGNMEFLPLNMGGYTIRRIGPEDSRSYIDMMNAGFKKEGDVLYNENSFPALLSSTERYVFFIEKQGEPAATAAISLQEDIGRGFIYNVTVYKEYRGQGLGEAAIKHCINTIEEKGLRKATLSVDGENRGALNLYKKIGFLEIDTDVVLRLEME